MATCGPRRTQQERRETTIARLLDAGVQTISQIGYSRTTAKQVCSRAGVSHGALFLYHSTMLDFVVAMAEHAARQQLTAFQSSLLTAPPDKPVETALRLLAATSSTPFNAVFYELVVAARTDPALLAALQPMMESYTTDIEALAGALPGLEHLDPATLRVLLFMILDMFDGAAVRRTVQPLASLDEQRIPILLALLRGQLAILTPDEMQ